MNAQPTTAISTCYELTFTDRNGYADTDTIDTLEHVNDTIHERAQMHQTLTNIRLIPMKVSSFCFDPCDPLLKR